MGVFLKAGCLGLYLLVLYSTTSLGSNYKDFPVLDKTDDIPWKFEMPDVLGAVGDTHGDPDALLAVLEHIEFVNSNGDWIAGKAHLVLMGDLVGKGPHSRANWELALSLKAKAARASGMVHILLGNHELSVQEGLFAAHLGQDDFWAYDEFAPGLTFDQKVGMPGIDQVVRGMKAMAVAWAAPGSPYAAELSTRNTILRIGELVFIHGGLDDYLYEAPIEHVDKINYTYRKLVRSLQKQLLGDDKTMDTFREMEWLLQSGGEGPMWTREIARTEYSRERFEKMMSVLGARKLIIGHSPTEERVIQSLYNGKVFNIDTGISRAIARGSLSAMVFKKNGQFSIFNKIDRKTYHPVAQAIRKRFLPNYNDASRRKSWGCFAEVALRDGVLSAYAQ